MNVICTFVIQNYPWGSNVVAFSSKPIGMVLMVYLLFDKYFDVSLCSGLWLAQLDHFESFSELAYGMNTLSISAMH